MARRNKFKDFRIEIKVKRLDNGLESEIHLSKDDIFHDAGGNYGVLGVKVRLSGQETKGSIQDLDRREVGS